MTAILESVALRHIAEDTTPTIQTTLNKRLSGVASEPA
jgi:hypothetical protein